MIAIISLLTVLTLSVLIIRIATVALAHTGLAVESARFQARSAFLGVGFTTDEAESIVNHPVRRQIASWLMICGNAGIITAISSLILSFVQTGEGTAFSARVSVLICGLGLLWFLGTSSWVDRRLSRCIEHLLARYTDLRVADYASLLDLDGEYVISTLKVQQDEWLANRTLAETKLRDEGVIVLGIKRKDGNYRGAPRGDTKIVSGDTLLLYGRDQALQALDIREMGSRGDSEHSSAVSEQEAVEKQEKADDSVNHSVDNL